jgi:hypothetical protein
MGYPVGLSTKRRGLPGERQTGIERMAIDCLMVGGCFPATSKP